MFGQSLLSGAFGTALVPGENFGTQEYIGNAAINTIGGKFGGCALFNGSTNYWAAGTSPVDTSGAFSFSFWAYFNSISTYDWIIGTQQTGSPYAGCGLFGNASNKLGIALAGAGPTQMTGTLPLYTWTHIAFTHDGSGNYKCYTNAEAPITYSGVTSNNSRFIAGLSGVSGWAAMDGMLDQVRIYNDELTSTEVTSLYNETASNNNTLNFPTGAGCVAAYTFNNNGNTILSQNDLDTVDFPSGTGCVGLYQLQTTGVDTAGNNNGTLVNSPVTKDPLGPFGDCMDFTTGSTQWINLGTGVYDGYTAMTVATWVWWDSPSSYSYCFWAGDGATAGEGIGLAVRTSDWKMYSYNGSTSQVTNTVFNSYQWYHVAVTYSGTTCKWYVNGDLDSTHTVTAMNLDASSLQTGIGVYNGNPVGAQYTMDGKLAQMRIYNTALTDAQIETIARGEPKYNGTVWPSGTGIDFAGSVNFKPDFVWAKATDQAYNSALYDSVRGGQYQLASNSTSTAWNSSGSGGVRKFQDTGFVMGSGENANSVAGTNAVAWMWKGGADTYGGLFNGDVNISYELNNWLELYAASFSQPIITGSTDFGVSCWVKFHTIAAASTGVVGNFQTGVTPQAGWTIAHQSGTPFQFWADGTANSSGGMAQATTTPVAHKWYHVVGTYDGSNVKIYVNGTLENTVAYTSTPLSTASNFQIGRWYGNFNDYYTNGVIDQVRIFNSAPTQPEVTALYNESAGNNNTLNFPAGAGCIAAYTLNNTPNSVLNESDLATCNFPSGAGCEVLYQLNDNVTDTCGNHNGTATDITYTTGKFGQGVKFNGSTSKIAVSDPVLPNGACSISFWYNPSGATGSSTSEYILGCGAATGSKGVTVYWYNQSFGAMVLKGSSSLAGYANGTGTFSTTDWYNVVFTWDGSTSSNAFKVYVNGVLNAQGTSDTSSASIGTYTDFAMGLTTSNPASGKLDQVRIFNTELTQSQIRELNRGNYNLYPYGNFDPGTPAESYIKSGYLGRNNDGNLESQVSANQDAGFSVVTYSPNDTVGMTVGHGLKSSPELVITKRLDSSQDWGVYTNISTGDSTTNWLVLNTDAVYGAGSYMTLNTSTLELPQTGAYWGLGTWQVAYCWHSVSKYSKIGTYTWTGSSSTAGTMVTGLGFKPARVMIKGVDGAVCDWQLYDNRRGTYTVANKWQAYPVYANGTWVESTSGYQGILFDDDGFSAGVGADGNTTASGSLNTSGKTYLYMAFAE